MEFNPQYENLIGRLKACAKWLACMIGWPEYDVDLAGEDFRHYLENCSPADGDYPPWGAESALVDYVFKLESYSGTGNPFSPIVYVGSELGSSLLKDWSLYFKVCADIFWKDIFGVPLKCPSVLDRLERDFKKHWGGANERGYKETPWASYVNALNSPFYQTLREQLRRDPELWRNYHFIIYQSLYHTKREGRHQWTIAADFLSILLLSRKENPRPFYEGKELGEPFGLSNPPRGFFFDELLFLTEANVVPYAAGDSGDYRGNKFLEFALTKFNQGRIFILHPSTKHDEKIRFRLEEFLRDLGSQKVFDCCNHYGNLKNPLKLYKLNKHRIIFSPMNLTTSVPNKLLLDLARFCKRNRLGGW